MAAARAQRSGACVCVQSRRVSRSVVAHDAVMSCARPHTFAHVRASTRCRGSAALGGAALPTGAGEGGWAREAGMEFHRGWCEREGGGSGRARV
eukprot:6184129-Pleurochrysis_carterae.AAC.1